MKKFKRDIAIGIVEKVQETSSDTGVHNRAITVSWKAETHPQLATI